MSPASAKILCFSEQNKKDRKKIVCPHCRRSFCRRHSCYIRKGFHRRNEATVILIRVPRYRCLNEECPHRTFSILPPLVLRYTRFFWPDLVAIQKARALGTPLFCLAKVFNVGRRVIAGAEAVLGQLSVWIGQLYREVTDGAHQGALLFMVKSIIRKLGYTELLDRWYCHRYPARFRCKKPQHTIQHAYPDG
jgi:hypothetical protein